MPFVLVHRHTALCALSLFVALQFTSAAPTLQENHATSQIRKSCTARKDSVRRRRALLSPLVPTRARTYNGNFFYVFLPSESSFRPPLGAFVPGAAGCGRRARAGTCGLSRLPQRPS